MSAKFILVLGAAFAASCGVGKLSASGGDSGGAGGAATDGKTTDGEARSDVSSDGSKNDGTQTGEKGATTTETDPKQLVASDQVTAVVPIPPRTICSR
jgi:hypothetical protein